MTDLARPQWTAAADQLAAAQHLADRVGSIAAVQLDRCPPLPEVEDGPLAEDWREQRWYETIPRRFHFARSDGLDRGWPLLDRLLGWAAWGTEHLPPEQRRPVPNLMLYGPTGSGKSHAAVAAAREHYERGAEVAFWPVAELLDGLRPGGPDDLWARLVEDTDILILDDLGAHRGTEWADERLDALVNRRWMDERATVVTTNLPPDKLADAVGERAVSRLVDQSIGSLVLQVGGADRRLVTPAQLEAPR